MGYRWKPEEVEKLKEMLAKECTKTEIMNALGRSSDAVICKVRSLGLVIYNTSDVGGTKWRSWKPAEIEEFSELWVDPTVSMNVMCKKLHRRPWSLKKKALQLHLGGRPYDTEFLSVSTIQAEMQISKDQVYYWFGQGLKKKRSRSGNRHRYLVDPDELLAFLEYHQDSFDASKVSNYLFIEEPKWLVEKRRKDMEFYPGNLRYEFTDEQDKKIQDMFHHGFSDAEIGKAIGRTRGSVQRRRYVLNLIRRVWTDKELEFIRQNAPYRTAKEMSQMLEGRSESAVCTACAKNDIRFHVSKSRCKPLPSDMIP